MSRSLRDQTLALAGVFQATCLVRQITRRGMADSAAMESSIGSILRIDADSVASIFGDVHGVQTGLRQLGGQIAATASSDVEISKYVAALLFLEQRLMQSPRVANQLHAGIHKCIAQAEQLSTLHSDVLASLADLYQSTISTLGRRIMVSGGRQHLSNPENANRIRALLLAGIRSAVLWRQCGGSRWRLLLGRRRLLSEAQALLA